MKSLRDKLENPIFLGFVCVIFLVYIYLALMFNHSLFRGIIYFILTFLFIIILSILFPIKDSKKISFMELSKIVFTLLPFILGAILFLFLQGMELLENLNKIAPVNKFYLANSIIMLYMTVFSLFLFSYLSDNVENKKVSLIFYRILIGLMLLFLSIIISLFGSIISYFTLIPGP